MFHFSKNVFPLSVGEDQLMYFLEFKGTGFSQAVIINSMATGYLYGQRKIMVLPTQAASVVTFFFVQAPTVFLPISKI